MQLKRATRAEIAEAFGVDLRTVTNWNKDGMPRHKSGCYSLPAVIKWRREKDLLAAKPKDNDEEKEKDRWLGEVRKEQARTARLKRLELQETLVPKETMFQIMAEEVTAAKSAFRGMRRKLPPRLAGLDVAQIEILLGEEVDEILKRLARRSNDPKR